MQPGVAEIVEPCAIAVESDAYERLALEYDGLDHRTTRILEALSRRALARARHASDERLVHRILELGAGTGALTTSLLDRWPAAVVFATDPSETMLRVLGRKLGVAGGRLTTAVAAVSEARDVVDVPPDMVAAGLADPFLDDASLRAVRSIVPAGALFFVTVPSRSWARRERSRRLGIPLGITRFCLRDGNVVFAKSFTYDESDAKALLREAGFAAIALGTESSSDTWSCPEVCWALAVAV